MIKIKNISAGPFHISDSDIILEGFQTMEVKTESDQIKQAITLGLLEKVVDATQRKTKKIKPENTDQKTSLENLNKNKNTDLYA